ncbi:MAG: hypothetical protein ACLFR8_03540 [Alkalispirochaeta sp.]
MQPHFVAFDTKQREELLSQTGNFSPGERDGFHKLCQNWQSRIPYNRFAGLLNRGDGATTSDLHSLMTKLRKAGYGLIRTNVQEGQRQREAIILTDPFSREFVSELLDEYFNDLLESIVNPMPLLSMINEEFSGFPTREFTQVSSDELAKEYATEEHPETPLAIQTLDNDRLLVTRGKLRPFITVAMHKLRYYLSNTTILELAAKLLDTSLIALKQKIAGKEPALWLSVTKVIVDKRRDFDALRTASIDANFYHAAWLLRRLLESQITEAEQKKKEAENRQLDLEAIAMAVKEAPEGWMEQEQLTRTLESVREKYENSFDSFTDEFYEKYVHARGKNSLPKVVQLGTRYLHRDRVFPLFLGHFRTTEDDLKLIFITRMEQLLRSGNSGGDTTFVDLDSFDAAILEIIRQRDPFLADLIEKPAILAEGMILHAKQNKLVNDVTELKQRLAIYFDPETMKPLPLHEWFNLRLLEIFETAFEKLPILKRIWIRLTGKYESFRNRYVGQSAIRRQERESTASYTDSRERVDRGRLREGGSERRGGTEAMRGRDRASSTGSRDRGRGGTVRRSASTPGGRSGAGAHSGSASDAAVKRAYTKKQVDSAWEQFGSSIKKKD